MNVGVFLKYFETSTFSYFAAYFYEKRPVQRTRGVLDIQSFVRLFYCQRVRHPKYTFLFFFFLLSCMQHSLGSTTFL